MPQMHKRKTDTVIPVRSDGKSDIAGAWAAREKDLWAKPWNIFPDESANMNGNWLYTRAGKMTFVVVSLIIGACVFWYGHHHGQRIYTENEFLIRSHIDPYANSLGGFGCAVLSFSASFG